MFVYLVVRVYLSIICVLFFLQSWGQTQDALKPDADTASINHLLNVAEKELNPDTGIAMYDKAYALSVTSHYGDGAFRALITEGIKYYEKEDYRDMRLYSAKSILWAEKSDKKDATAWCYNNIGLSYFSEGDYETAVDFYYKALNEIKRKQLPPTHTEVNIYNNFGSVYFKLNELDKSLAFFRKAAELSQKGNFDYQLAESYESMGDFYNKICNADSAIKYFNLVIIIGTKMNKTDLRAAGNEGLGEAYAMLHDFPKAIAYSQTAITLSENSFYDIAIDAAYNLGNVWYQTGKYKEAQNILESNLKEIRTHNAKDKYITCYTTLADVYKATSQYKKAIACMDTLAALNDSLTGIEKTKAISQLELKYKTAEQDKQIAQNQLVIARQNSNIIRKNIWIGAVSGGIALLALLVLVIYRNARHRQRLQAEQIKTLQKESTIGNLKSMVQGEENERARIARELHDGIGGTLSAAMMRLMAIRHDKEDVTNVPAYNEALALLDDMGAEIRKTAHNLMPETLLKQTLPEAVGSYCHSMQKDGVLHIDFQSMGDFGLLCADVKLNVYRMIQELLRNIVQHAQATTALVQLMMHGPTLTITVEDNGKGFDKGTMQPGMGMQNLQTRVGSLNGHYTLETAPGSGTTVFIEIDLTAPQP